MIPGMHFEVLYVLYFLSTLSTPIIFQLFFLMSKTELQQQQQQQYYLPFGTSTVAAFVRHCRLRGPVCLE